ncbi:hypothetical protein FOCC_FOCC002238 [Frankliniella occidentalis]|nr:hypothetical protein FOCC_FOCC002238 [Frankliniella occidentalis]
MSHSVTIIMALVLVFGTYCLAAVVAQGSGFNYPMLKCLKTTDGNTVRFDIDQTLEDPHFQLDVWEVRGEDIAYPIVDSEDFVPFSECKSDL